MNPSVLKRWLVLCGLLAITLFLVWISPEKPQDSGIVLTHPRATVESSHVVPPVAANTPPAKFKLAHRLPITEAITDLFAAPSSVTQESSEPAAQTAPPLPFAYIGKMVENGQAKVFLQEGETLYGIKLGEKLGTNYQVTSINNDQIKFLYLPLKITQIMSIGTRLD